MRLNLNTAQNSRVLETTTDNDDIIDGTAIVEYAGKFYSYDDCTPSLVTYAERPLIAVQSQTAERKSVTNDDVGNLYGREIG